MLLTEDRHDDLLTFALRAKDAKLYSKAEFDRFAMVLKEWRGVPRREDMGSSDRSWAVRLEGDFRRYAKSTAEELAALASIVSRAGTEMPSTVEIYVVYENPSDFPGRFVVRRGQVRRHSPGRMTMDGSPAALCATLKEARQAVPVGRVRMRRHPDDDACIVESWL